MRFHFHKVQALRNDFVLLDGRRQPVADPAGLARVLCDRKSGIGADTLLLLLESEEADALVRIFNPDGSEGEMSGNGTRCVAGHLFAGEREGRSVVTVETVAGVSEHVHEGGEGRRCTVTSRIVAPRFRPADIPVRVDGEEAIDAPFPIPTGTILVSCVSIGNPQAVVFEGWDESNWTDLGPLIENHALFPERANVDFARVEARDRIAVRLWERGVGPVEASGTGASGAFATARRKGLVDAEVDVHMEGGTLRIAETEGGLSLSGWCEEVFEGTIEV